MKKFVYPFLALLLVVALPVHAKDAPAAPHYLDPATIDPKALLPNPPADGSPETLKEIEVILEKQRTRTPAEVARAKSEVKLDVFAFADVLGPWFTAKNLQATTSLFQNVNDDSRLVTDAAKKDWARPRPYDQDKRIHPVVDLEKSMSYPSGHATRGMLFALVLAELVPSQKDAILARGKQIGDDRVLGGVHFPSDVAAGQKVADAIFVKLVENEAFQEDLVVAKTEVGGISSKQ